MDWDLAIERNRCALVRIVAGLIAMVGALTVERVPRKVYRGVLFILRPAESAMRRLIIAAARNIVLKPSAVRVFPAGITRKGGTPSAPRFQLFDRRKRFDFSGRVRPRAKPGRGPAITFFVDDPRAPPFRAAPIQTIFLNPPREPSETVAVRRLCRRLGAIQSALENLPREAMRLARWRGRRARMKVAKFRDPLRPGAPPGKRRKSRHEVDDILKECQWLALEAQKPNTS